MARVNRFIAGFFALFIIVSLLLAEAWGSTGGLLPRASTVAQTPTADTSGDTVLPPGASEDWWGSVQEQILQSEYSISWQEQTGLPHLAAAYQAPNRTQNLRTYFTGSGIQLAPRTADVTPTWNLGLTLTGYGYQDSSRPVAAAEMSVQDNRADYDRGDVAEWYVNTEEGLEQGFTLNAPPSGTPTGTLVLQLSLSGNLTPALAEQGEAIDFTTPGGVRVLRYADLKVNDAEGNILDADLAIGEGGLSISIDAAFAAFPVTVDPVVTTPGWTAESNQEQGHLGYSVGTAGDVNGDGYSDVIVGAPDYSNGESQEGAAFVYHGSAGGLSSTHNWMADSGQIGADFGCSVGTAGDVNGDGYSDVIVGAEEYIKGSSRVGKAYVYHGSSGGLSSTPNWTVEGNQADAYFGCAVGTAGDVNGDGFSDVIVGAYYYDNPESNEGAAFVYHGSSSGLSTSAAWTGDSDQELALFGNSVGTAGDVNGDGYADVIVGARLYDHTESAEGAAFVYRGSSSGLGTSAPWIAESNQAGAMLGESVGTAGDVNGDGYADVIVGAYQYTNGSSGEGMALVWHGSSSGVNENVDGTPGNADWTAEVDQASAFFGRSVGTAGDVDGDGYADVIVGGELWDNGETNEGGAAIYRGSSLGLDDTAVWAGESDQDGAYYGISVATAGDVNGDGYADVIVGAYGYDNPDSSEGRAYVYHGYASGLMATPLWAGQSDQAGAHFGFSVATAGDVNGDGYADVIVGATYYDGGQTDEGRAYIYHGSAAGLSPTYDRTLECNAAGAQFGFSVGTAGDVNGDGYDDVIIGANAYDNDVIEWSEGAVYLYYGSAGGLSATPAWSKEGNQQGANLGSSVGTAGDVNGDGYADVIVGAQGYKATYTGEGRAYVFHGSAPGLATTASWTVDGGEENASFGCSVSTAGDVNRDGFSDVIVGAYGHGTVGAAFVYHGSASGLSTSPAWSKESDQASAQFGRAVSTAGDVNGDGYADVIIGAWHFASPEASEGAAFVYHGSASGLSTMQNWSAQSNLADTELGYSVDTAGDVNGDGYADVVIGAPYYTHGQTNEGAAVLWYGSAAGLGDSGTPANADWGVEGNQENARFGCSVATAGDVNGDGYADIIIGAFYYDYGETDEGAAFLYYGGGHRGVSLNPWQRRVDSTAPVAHMGTSDEPDYIRISILQYTPFGRGKARPQFEVKPLGAPFDGTGIVEAGTWSLTGGVYSYPVGGLSGHTVYHWRVRLHYNSATTPFQQYSRWVTMPWNGWQEADFRTPNTPPVAENDSYSTNEDTPLTVAASGVLGNDSDAEGDPFTALKVTDPGHGTVTLNSNGSFTYTPATNYTGGDSFTYKANDGRDDSNTATVSITVNPVNDAPGFTKGANQSVAEDAGAQTVSGWATAISPGPSDESGQTVDFIVSSDNTSLFSVQPAVSPGGTLTYTPAANADGTVTVTVRIHDNGGTASGGVDTSAAHTFTITVTAVNDAPTAAADAYSAHRDAALTVTAPGVLANDTDIEGNPLTAALVSSVSHGALTLNPDGSFIYTPTAGYSGADSFTYRAHDGSDYSGTVTVTITVHAENTVPVATADSYTVAEDTALVVAAATGVLNNDTDADTDPLKAILVSSVSHGVLTLNENGSFTYTPAANFNGTDSFTYKANDGLADSPAATVTITATPVNDLPVAAGDAYQAFAGIAQTVAAPGLLANDSDADGNTLAAVLVGNVSHGTLTLNADGSFTYTAESGFAGADSFTYKVSDGTGDSAAATVTMHVALPEPPTITSITKSSGRRGGTQTVTIAGTNLDGAALSFGEGITVNILAGSNDTEISAEITIDSDAALGARDVVVTTPEGTFTLEDGFTVGMAKSGGMPFWVWILVAIGIVAAAAMGIVFWRKQSAKPA